MTGKNRHHFNNIVPEAIESAMEKILTAGDENEFTFAFVSPPVITRSINIFEKKDSKKQEADMLPKQLYIHILFPLYSGLFQM
jgi:hypothetical protein